MFYCTSTQQYIQEGSPFEINGTQYPSNWLNLSSPQDKLSIGLEEVIATNSPANDKFYWVSSSLNGADLTYTNTPKDLDACKAMLISQVKATAGSMLSATDWKIIRAAETGVAASSEVLAERAAIRTASNDNETAINACTSVDELAVLQLVFPQKEVLAPVEPPIEA